MAEAKVEFHRVQTAKKASKRDVLSTDEFLAEFDVTVDADGCYAFEVILWQDKFVIPNIEIASTRGAPHCYCLKKAKPRKFAVSAAASPPDKVDPLKMTDPTDRTSLAPVYGKWPTDDGWFDNTLQVFVEVIVYECSGTASCDADKDCPTQQPWDYMMGPRGKGKSRVNDVTIRDGDGNEKGIDAVTGAAGKAVPFMPKLYSAAPEVQELHARVARLEMQLGRLQRRDGACG